MVKIWYFLARSGRVGVGGLAIVRNTSRAQVAQQKVTVARSTFTGARSSEMKLSGKLLDIEHKAGQFVNDRGESVSYDFVVLHVLEGREVHKVRLPREVNVLDLPYEKGDDIEVAVTVPANTKVLYAGAVPALV